MDQTDVGFRSCLHPCEQKWKMPTHTILEVSNNLQLYHKVYKKWPAKSKRKLPFSTKLTFDFYIFECFSPHPVDDICHSKSFTNHLLMKNKNNRVWCISNIYFWFFIFYFLESSLNFIYNAVYINRSYRFPLFLTFWARLTFWVNCKDM